MQKPPYTSPFDIWGVGALLRDRKTRETVHSESMSLAHQNAVKALRVEDLVNWNLYQMLSAHLQYGYARSFWHPSPPLPPTHH